MHKVANSERKSVRGACASRHQCLHLSCLWLCMHESRIFQQRRREFVWIFLMDRGGAVAEVCIFLLAVVLFMLATITTQLSEMINHSTISAVAAHHPIPYLALACGSIFWAWAVVWQCLSRHNPVLAFFATLGLMVVGIFPTKLEKDHIHWLPEIMTTYMDLDGCSKWHLFGALCHTGAVIFCQFNIYRERAPFLWCRSLPFRDTSRWVQATFRKPVTRFVFDAEKIARDRARDEKKRKMIILRKEDATWYIICYRTFRYDTPWWIVAELAFAALHGFFKLTSNSNMSLVSECFLFLLLELSFTSIQGIPKPKNAYNQY